MTSQPAVTSAELWKKVRSYGDFCDRLQRDASNLRTDTQAEEEGWTLVVAVDFSELHAYGAPAGSSPLWPKGYFSDEFSFISERTAARCWFGRPQPAVLLEPYAIECRSHLASLMLGSLSDAAATHEAWRTSRVQSGPWITEVARIVEAGGTPSPDQLERIVTLLTDHAPALLSLLLSSKERRYRTIVDLINSKSVVGLKRIVGTIDALDDDRVSERSERLYQIRLDRIESGDKKNKEARIDKLDRGTCYIDGRALELVDQANRVLQASKQRMILVSRSTTMADLDAEEHARGLVSGPRVRHPRLAMMALAAPGEKASAYGSLDHKALVASTVEIDKAVMAFSLSVKAAKESDSVDEKARTEIVAELDRARQRFQELSFARAARNELLSKSHEPRGESSATAHLDWRLLHALTSGKASVLDALSERGKQLAQRLSDANAKVGWSLVSGPQTSVAYLKDNLTFEPGPRTLVIRSSANPVPYSLKLERSDVNASVGGEVGITQWSALLNRLEEFEKDDGVQRYLFMGYTLAVLSQWALAEEYFSLACGLSSKSNELSGAEANFFWAVSRRKYDPTPERLRESLRRVLRVRKSILKRAPVVSGTRRAEEAPETEEVKRSASLGRQNEDPRFLAEVAAIGITWLSIVQELKSSRWPSPKRDWLPRIAQLIDRAEKNIANDRNLLLYVYNLKCYLAIVAVERGHALGSRLKGDVAQLQSFALACERNVKKWPLYLLDTVAFGMSLAGYPKQEWANYCAILERELDRQHESLQYPQQDLARVKRHVLKMKTRPVQG